MAGLFDKKVFNAEVFQKYMERIPDVLKNQLIKSKAIRIRPELADSMRDEVAGNYISTPLLGIIDGDPDNYDGSTDISVSDTDSYLHSRVVTGRAKSFAEKDFSYDITGGTDFMENIAQQIHNYWEKIDQRILVSILKGVFAMTGEANLAFVNAHTTDVTSNAASGDVAAGCFGPATLNKAMQKACGDNKGIFSLAIMHSEVATNLENLKLLSYMKYTDANGIERDLNLGTLNGRTVLIDDTMPSETRYTSGGTYKVSFGGTYAQNDKVSVAGEEITVGETATAAAIASALATALASNANYTASAGSDADAGKLILVEKSGKYGTGAPAVSKTSTAGTVSVATATAPASVTAYTTFVLGEGAIELTDCGAKVPYEADRDTRKNGGMDYLITRQRKSYAPYGISFTKSSMSKASPTNAELENGSNWELVHTGASPYTYFSHKAIPIARVISLG